MVETLEQTYIYDLLDQGEFIFFQWENKEGWPVAFVSGNTTEILGYTPHEFRSGSISYSTIIHPDDFERVTEEVETFSRNGAARFVHEPYRLIKKNGEIIWVYDTTRIFRDKNHKITHFAGYIHDITPLKEKEISLQQRTKNLEYEISGKIRTIQEQKQIFKTLVEKSSDGIILLKNEYFFSANDAAVTILGYENKEELYSSTFYDILFTPGKNNRQIRTEVQRIIAIALTEGSYRFEWQYEQKEGVSIWLDIVLTKIILSGEEVLYARLHPIDDLKNLQYQLFTLNKRLQEDFKIQKSFYEELFNSTKDGIILFEQETVFEYNQAVLEMMHIADIVHLQKVIATFFDPKYALNLKEKFYLAKKEGLHRFEWLIERSDGSNLWVEVTLTPMKIDQKEIIHSHWRNITRRKELEIINEEKTKQLIEQSRFAQMGEMISMIAHQWRQPLSVIAAAVTAMHTKLLTGNLRCSTEEEMKEAFGYFFANFTKINHNIQYMSQTINDFRDFFKPNKKATHFYLYDAIKRAYTMIEQSFRSKGIQVDFYLGDTPEIYCYENEIVHVLLNLLKNAEDVLIEHKILNPKIIITLSLEENLHVITVTDNGGGISEEQIEKIFDPYFSTKSKNGTGLGLYMSKTIIEEHCHGKLSVINTGDGASFTIMLPPSIEDSLSVL